MGLQKIKIINACDKIILFSVYAIAFFLPISKAIIESFSILAIACFIVKKILQRESIPNTHISFAIFAYLTVCFVSIFLSSNFKITFRSFFNKTVQNALFFFVVVDALNEKNRLRNIIYILLASSALLGIDGIYQYFTHKDFIRNRPDFMLPRIYATFPSPSDFGCYLITLIPFALVNFFVKLRFKIYRILFVCLFVLLFSCLTLTVSRGAWFGFIASILFMSIWMRFLALFFVILGIIIIVIHPFLNQYIKVRLGDFFIFLDRSSLDRMVMWDAAWKMFMSRPWLGVGLGTFMFNFRKFVDPGFPYIAYAHNCYLQMVAEIGIIGLLSFLSIIILLLYHGIITLNSKQKTFSWYVLLASIAGILGYCIQMLVDTNFYSLDLGMLFWLLLGLGVAAIRNIYLFKNTEV